jgi:hypothetical protein
MKMKVLQCYKMKQKKPQCLPKNYLHSYNKSNAVIIKNEMPELGCGSSSTVPASQAQGQVQMKSLWN